MQVLATAAMLAAAIVAAALLQRHHLTTAPSAAVSAPPTASAIASPLPAVPAADLAAAKLTGASALVTPFQWLRTTEPPRP